MNSVKSVIWSAFLQWFRLGIGALVFLLCARWLTLTELGIFAALQAPILFLQTFQRGVIPDAVVQEVGVSQARLGTLNMLSVASGAVMSLALAVAAFFLNRWTSYPGVGPMLFCLSLSPLLLGASAVHEGLLRRNLQIKALAIRTGITLTLAAVPTVIMAALGFGGWALVVYTLANVTIASVLTIMMCPWRTRFAFDRVYFSIVLPKLYALLGRYVISAAVTPILQILVTTQLGVAAGGVFQISLRLLNLIDSLIGTPARFVALPLLAKTSGDLDRFSTGLLTGTTYSLMLAAPAYLGLAALSPLFLPAVLGDNGQASVTAFQALAIYGPAGLVSGLIAQGLVGRGEAVRVFYRALLMALSALVPCVIASAYSVEAVAFVYALVGGYVGLIPTLLILDRYCGVKASSLLRRCYPPMLAATIMGLGVGAATYALVPNVSGPWVWSAMIGLVGGGGMIYTALLFSVAPHDARDLFGAVLNAIRRKNSA